MSHRSHASAASLLLICGLVACRPAEPVAPSSGPDLSLHPSAEPAPALQVLTSFSILADLTRQVAGPQVQVDSLLPVGADPHAFQPSVQDRQRVIDADLVIVNGAGLEAGFEDLLTPEDGSEPVVLTEGLALRPTDDEHEEGHEEGDEHEEGHIEEAGGTEGDAAEHAHEDAHETEQAGATEEPSHDEHHHGPHDPHAWLDPRMAQAYVQAIAAALSAADQAGAAGYAERAAAYEAQLVALDAEITELLAPIPAARRVLVTDHEVLGYFADRYRLDILGAIVPSTSSSAEPAAQDLAELTEVLRKEGAPAIFLRAGASRRLADALAAEAGVAVVDDLYLESLSAPDGPAPDYLTLMRHNARRIAAALGGAP